MSGLANMIAHCRWLLTAPYGGGLSRSEWLIVQTKRAIRDFEAEGLDCSDFHKINGTVPLRPANLSRAVMPFTKPCPVARRKGDPRRLTEYLRATGWLICGAGDLTEE